ncbi:glycosyltransferase [Arcanobacterium bovis]|uniref:glycosyltransferase n=1 Tax=Arcanobacterium bovis TaxID=2529275 RepID=UPI0013F15702|nr:glycosyltransferase [Arcanobacterium bovis]
MAAASAEHLILRENVLAIIVSHGQDDEYLSQTLQAVRAQSWAPQHVYVARSGGEAPKNVLDSAIQSTAFPRERLSYVDTSGAENFGQCISRVLDAIKSDDVTAGAAARDTRDTTDTLDNADTLAIANAASTVDGANAAEATVTHALDSGAAATAASSRNWYWFLHADSAAHPDALDVLLRKGETSTRIGAIGPKQISWDSDFEGTRRLLEVGINATRSARRVPEIDYDERDQGQYDSREDVLGIGTAGMLVRADVYHELGGFDPFLGPFGDGLEFSRRIRAAGYRVIVAPAAQIRHARLSYENTSANSTSLDGVDQSFAARRRAQIYNSLLTMPLWQACFAWLGYVCAAIPRALIRLAFRDFTRARGELKAGWNILAALASIRNGRNNLRLAGGNAAGIEELEATGATIRAVKRETKKSRSEAVKLFALPDPLTRQAQANLRLHTRKGGLATLISALLVALLFNLPYISDGVLSGGGLLPDNSTAGQLWEALRQSWLASGDGYAVPIDALWAMYLPILVLLSPFGVTLGQLITATLYVAFPIAAFGMYLLAGRFTKSSVVRYFAALLWIVAPSLLEAHATGHVDVVIVHTLLPLALWAMIGAWRKVPGTLGIAALLGATLAAASPIMLIFVLVGAAIGLIANRRLVWLWLPIPSIVALLPLIRFVSINPSYWLPALFNSPNSHFVANIQPRNVLFGFVTHNFAVSGWDALLYVPLLVIVGVGALTCLRNQYWLRIRFAWLIAVAGMALALAATYVPISSVFTADGMRTVHAWPGVELSICWLGLVAAIVMGAHGLKSTLRKQSFGFAHLLSFTSMLAVPLAIIAIVVQWTHIQVSTESVLNSAPAQSVPALAQNNRESDQRSRVLALQAFPNGIEAQVWRMDGLQMHEMPIGRAISGIGGRPDPLVENTISAEHPDIDDRATTDLEQTIADITAGSREVAAKLGDHAISVILVPPASKNAVSSDRAKLISYLNAVPGLERVTENETGEFWRVTALQNSRTSAAALRLITDDGGVVTSVPALRYGTKTDISVAKPSTLVLAERASSGWKAEVDGVELDVKPSDWAQTWTVPAGTVGELRITHEDPFATILLILQLAVALIAVVVALPLRPERREAQ